MGAIINLLSYPFLFMPAIGLKSEREITFYYLIFSVFWNFGWCINQISHLAMIPEITPNEHDRMTLSSIRNAATVISNLLTYALFLLFVKAGNWMK